MEKIIVILIISLMVVSGCGEKSPTKSEPDPESFLTPQQVLPNIMRGINIGNTLEPPDEAGWNAGPLQEYYFDDYKEAGFTCIRIPVRWGPHTAESSPFEVGSAWMARIEQVVDWGLERGLYLIINGHHEEWLKNDFSQENQTRYDSIWSQIAVRFKDKSPRLMFEMINEPQGLTIEQVDALNSRLLSIIRKSNPRRIVILSGNGWSALEDMMNAAIPDDDYLMAYWHAYNPWSFAGEGNGTWGNENDRHAIYEMFALAAAWSQSHNIPVMISEFGAIHACDYNSRMIHYYTYVEAAIDNNVAFMAWDDDGGFKIYEREDRLWPEVKDILIHGYPDGPDKLMVQQNFTDAVLHWQNRTSQNNGIVIERGNDNFRFSEVAQLSADIVQYTDTTTVSDSTYYYRVISKMDDGTDKYSYPVRISLVKK